MKLKCNYSSFRSSFFIAVLACAQFLSSAPTFSGTKSKTEEPRTLQECKNDSSLASKMTGPISILTEFLSDAELAALSQVDRGTYYAAEKAKKTTRKSFKLSPVDSSKKDVYPNLTKYLESLNENLEELDLSYLETPSKKGGFDYETVTKLLSLIQDRFKKLTVLRIPRLLIDRADLPIISKIVSLKELVVCDVSPDVLKNLPNLTILKVDKVSWSRALELLSIKPKLANLNVGNLGDDINSTDAMFQSLLKQNNPVALAAFGWLFYVKKRQTLLSRRGKHSWDQLEGYSEAKAALELAASSGNYYAQFTLGKILLSSRNISEEDRSKAFSFILQAADQDYAPALSDAATMLRFGRGTEKNLPKALELYEKVAKLGNMLAHVSLAEMYEKEEGIPELKETKTYCSDPGDDSTLSDKEVVAQRAAIEAKRELDRKMMRFERRYLALQNAYKWYASEHRTWHIVEPNRDMKRVEAEMADIREVLVSLKIEAKYSDLAKYPDLSGYSKWETSSTSEH